MVRTIERIELGSNVIRLQKVDFVPSEPPTGLINGLNTVFTLAFVPAVDSVKVFLNGIRQTQGVDYTLSGQTITFTIAPIISAILRVAYWARTIV